MFKVPCIYHMHGSEADLRRLKELVEDAGGVAGDVSIEEGPEGTQSQSFTTP